LAISDEVYNKEKFTQDDIKANLKKNEALDVVL
jgi:hypothetical protein